MIQEFNFFSAYFRFIICFVAQFGAVPLTFAIFYKIMFKHETGFKIFLYFIGNVLIFIATYSIIYYLTTNAVNLAYNELSQSLTTTNNK